MNKLLISIIIMSLCSCSNTVTEEQRLQKTKACLKTATGIPFAIYDNKGNVIDVGCANL